MTSRQLFKLRYLDCINYHNPVSVIQTNFLCENGVHEKIIKILENEIGLPWEEDNSLLKEILDENGIPRDSVTSCHGEICFIKRLPTFGHYSSLVEEIEELYDQQFVTFYITPKKQTPN